MSLYVDLSNKVTPHKMRTRLGVPLSTCCHPVLPRRSCDDYARALAKSLCCSSMSREIVRWFCIPNFIGAPVDVAPALPYRSRGCTRRILALLVVFPFARYRHDFIRHTNPVEKCVRVRLNAVGRGKCSPGDAELRSPRDPRSARSAKSAWAGHACVSGCHHAA